MVCVRFSHFFHWCKQKTKKGQLGEVAVLHCFILSGPVGEQVAIRENILYVSEISCMNSLNELA